MLEHHLLCFSVVRIAKLRRSGYLEVVFITRKRGHNFILREANHQELETKVKEALTETKSEMVRGVSRKSRCISTNPNGSEASEYVIA
ncbi:hypothetical protein D3Z70_09140 [Vibrio parahaemolyticus]|uniref:Uncharacterized protein n=1 Tax=Vibrio parahaemolyticus TaxID=670 RepID=A0AAW3IUD0_VIBPH|nr:hypothetical protein [Vibrio parahaemolyticus]EGR1785041.1 hypothetical protein [Vibrio parahaemolyticus]EGR2384763.1 hypothetical protein [Vibrio parahaemolyticus]EGR2892690.1 hypothetical protein [Vibrio parahaemolyticus]EGR2933238.1 hypothetical protein [Vibrio parahaemolyticus]